MINNYLNFLQESKNHKDHSLPNPYDYQSIQLKKGVSNKDIKILGQWLQKNKKFLDPDTNLDSVKWLFYSDSGYDDEGKRYYTLDEPIDKQHVFTIIDKGRSVGIVKYRYGSLTWASWVSGYNYATRGTMKMLDLLKDQKVITRHFIKRELIRTNIYEKNKYSIQVAEKLKMKFDYKSYGSISYRFTKDIIFWWRDKKKWFNF